MCVTNAGYGAGNVPGSSGTQNLSAGQCFGALRRQAQVPFRFTGNLAKLTLTIDRPELSEADKQRLMASGRNNKKSEQR